MHFTQYAEYLDVFKLPIQRAPVKFETYQCLLGIKISGTFHMFTNLLQVWKRI